MYLAQTSTLQTQAPFYVNILQDIISSKNLQNKADIDTAITEAREIAKGEKNIFAIDNNHYFLVTTLISKYKEKLLAFQDNSFENDTYNEILELLK
ncbi:hypothetical protein [Flavobacterium salmonis]|uniref:Uncharacterized protein n=1 Tax=Flavobacterium salmonis TaxID=2654844 RepID=A0A6V6YQC4_9FLAO|nr:hypothetical protein [Flavobacterium salmonis]CAD0001685.1 hypothetical protein FLAT13_00748 [Flavobacterium salmonis]